MRQLDLFDAPAQPDLFEEDREPVLYRADPAKVRAELRALLARARAARELPWTREKLRYHQLVFPRMSRWLPPEEAARLCLAFETEVKRLLAA